MNEAGVAPAGLMPIQQPISQSRRLAAETQALFHGEQNFADAEKPDDRDEEVETVEHLLNAEREPQLAGHLVKADGTKPEAQHHRGDSLEGRFLAQPYETA